MFETAASIPDLIAKIEPSKQQVEIDFEIFARVVAIILEDNNRLPDAELERLNEEVEEEVHERSANQSQDNKMFKM